MLSQKRVENFSVVVVEFQRPRVEHAGCESRHSRERRVAYERVELIHISVVVMEVAWGLVWASTQSQRADGWRVTRKTDR